MYAFEAVKNHLAYNYDAEIVEADETLSGMKFAWLRIETAKGTMDVCLCTNGLMDIYKPNGTMKRYEPTYAQAIHYISQLVTCNGGIATAA